jgi:hypothetical protein
MVFLIQNTQNRDSHAIQIKLDELLRATQGAHVALLDLEELEEDELKKIRKNYTQLARNARSRLTLVILFNIGSTTYPTELSLTLAIQQKTKLWPGMNIQSTYNVEFDHDRH